MGSSSFLWATVTETGPVRVQVDGDTSTLTVTPDSLVPVESLTVGQRLRCELADHRLIIHGAVGIQAGDYVEQSEWDAWKPRMNGAWVEERLDDTLYRWTQRFIVTTAVSSTWGGWFITPSSLPVPAAPSGCTFEDVAVTACDNSGDAVSVLIGDTSTFWLARGQSLASTEFRCTAVAYGTKT